MLISFDYQKSLNQNLPYKYLEKRKIIGHRIEESNVKVKNVSSLIDWKQSEKHLHQE